MHSFIIILSTLTLNVLAQDVVTLFTIPPSVETVTILESDSTATTYSYSASCGTDDYSPIASSARLITSLRSASSATGSPFRASLSITTRPNNAIPTSTGRIPPTPLITTIQGTVTPAPASPLLHRQAGAVAASCDIANITQGPSTWEAHYTYHFSASNTQIRGFKTVSCAFGSGGFGTGIATCTERTSGLPESLNLVTQTTRVVDVEDYMSSSTVIAAVTSDTTTIMLVPPTRTTGASTSETSGGVGTLAFPTERAIAFAGGAAGLLVFGAGF